MDDTDTYKDNIRKGYKKDKNQYNKTYQMKTKIWHINKGKLINSSVEKNLKLNHKTKLNYIFKFKRNT